MTTNSLEKQLSHTWFLQCILPFHHLANSNLFFFRVQIALSLHKEIWSSLRSHNWISSWVSLGLITLKNAFRQNVRTGKSQGCFKGLNRVHRWEEVKLRFNWRGFNFCNPGNHSELKTISLPLVRRNISKIFKIGSALKFEYCRLNVIWNLTDDRRRYLLRIFTNWAERQC